MPTAPVAGAQSVGRALQLLNAFSAEQPALAMTDLVAATGLNRTTTYRLASALVQNGFLVRGADDDRYRLGPELIVLGWQAILANPLRQVSRPYLEELAESTGEMASLEILEGNRSVIIDEVKGAQQRRLNTSIGNAWPAHTTSTGKLLLAYLTPAERENILPQPLPAMTPASIVDRVTLEAVLAAIPGQGYARANNELETGLIEIAAPIFNHRSKVVAAVSIGGPPMRVTAERLPSFIQQLQAAAHCISLTQGYQP